MLAVVALSLLLTTLIYLHLSLYRTRKLYSHIPSFPLPLSWKWAGGHIDLIWDRRRQLGDHRIADFSLILDWIRRDLESSTMVIFLANRIMIYTIHLPLTSRVLSDHKTFLKVGARDAKLDYVNGERIFGDNGILMDPGTEIWHHKRKMMDPAFQKKFLKCLMGDMNRITDKLCNYLEQKCEGGKILDIYSIMNKTALEVVCTCGFSLNDDFIMLEESELNTAVVDMLRIIPLSLRHQFTFWIPWNFREEKKRLKVKNALVRGTVRKILDARIKSNLDKPDSTSNDILDHIIRGNMFSEEVSIEDILDDFAVFLVAGMETTAITMSCMVWLLLKHPEIAQKVIREVNEVYGDKEELDYEDLNKLVYLEQCLKECLRLHPPVQMQFRRNTYNEVKVEELLIPKRSEVVMSIESIHHQEEHWPNPHSFDPDRFAPGKKIEPFTYLPFTAGPRQCIGKHFAMMEAKVVLAKLYHTFTLYDPYPEERELKKVTNFTSKPKDGVFVRIES